MRRYPKIEFDRLQMYMGYPYVIDIPDAFGSITIKKITMGDVIKIGEKRFYESLNVFITNTTAYRLLLWNGGIDWNTFSDFELFVSLYKSLDPEIVNLIFEDLDFSKFQIRDRIVDEKGKIMPTLVYEDDSVEINEEVYQHIHQYLQTLFNMEPEEKITTDSILKQWYINKDKTHLANEESKKKTGENIQSFSMQTMISACVNHPGFKYKLSEIGEMGIMEFYDSVQRLQIYESSTALLKGMYSGMISSKDLDPSTYNWMREIK